MASLGGGNFFQVDQAGGAVAFESPFDAEIAELSAKLDETRLYYGSDDERAKMDEKRFASARLNQSASVSARARRGAFNVGAAGEKNLLGEKELVDAVANGVVALDELDKGSLPAALQPMAVEEQVAYVSQLADQRADLQRQIQSLAKDRDEFIAKKVEDAGGMEDSLDLQLYETVKEQAGKSGFEYKDGPAY